MFIRMRNDNSKKNSECKDSSTVVDGKKNKKPKTYVAESTTTGCSGSSCCCKCKGETKYNKSKDETHSPPDGVGFSFEACHLPLSLQADCFQRLVDSGSSIKHFFIDPELIHGVEKKMQHYTKIKPSMEIKSCWYDILYGTAQSTLLVLVRDTDDVCQQLKLPLILVPVQ